MFKFHEVLFIVATFIKAMFNSGIYKNNLGTDVVSLCGTRCSKGKVFFFPGPCRAKGKFN